MRTCCCILREKKPGQSLRWSWTAVGWVLLSVLLLLKIVSESTDNYIVFYEWCTTGVLNIKRLFFVCHAWNVPKPLWWVQTFESWFKIRFRFFFMETQTLSKATSLQSLWSLQVVCMNFFDIVLDFILMDAFEDLESPPSSVVAVLRNRWLSDSFKETVNKLHVDASHSSSICFTYLTREWCAFILLPGSGNSLLVCLESEKTSSHGELTCDHMLKTLPWRPRILTPRSASPHRFPMASSPISMPYQNMWARF